jgi:EpsI family protein
MGQIGYKKIILMTLCFVVTAFVIYQKPTSRVNEKKTSLNTALKDIKGWQSYEQIPIDNKIVNELKLDDYVNQQYVDGNESVFLYIGYYKTTKKLGALHDPLVCFPGQGWNVSDTKKSQWILNPDTGEKISFSSMIVTKGSQKELVIYWFQSYDEATPDTFSQKVTSFWKRIRNKGEDNAFVRITVYMGDKDALESSKTIFNFVRVFYPVFLDYIKG